MVLCTWIKEVGKIPIASATLRGTARTSTKTRWAWDFGLVIVVVLETLTPTQAGIQCPGSLLKKFLNPRLRSRGKTSIPAEALQMRQLKNCLILWAVCLIVGRDFNFFLRCCCSYLINDMRNGRNIYVFCCFGFFYLCLFSLFSTLLFLWYLDHNKANNRPRKRKKENELSLFHVFSIELNKTKEMGPCVLFFFLFFYVHLFWVWRAKYISNYLGLRFLHSFYIFTFYFWGDFKRVGCGYRTRAVLIHWDTRRVDVGVDSGLVHDNEQQF